METLKLGYCREVFNPDKPVRMNSSLTGETVFNDIYRWLTAHINK